jgi:hypothetical protein
MAPDWLALAVPAPAGGGAQVLAAFLDNVTRWLQYLATLAAVATVAYGGLRYAVATSPRAQAEAWRLILAGLGGLVIALLAPTLVGIAEGLIPAS